MKFLFRVPNLAFFDCAGVRLMLSNPESVELDHPASIIYYKVDDIKAAYETLRERGVTFEAAPHLIAGMPDYELWMCFVKDSEGNTLGLMCEMRHA